jgi:hypothetical protein
MKYKKGCWSILFYIALLGMNAKDRKIVEKFLGDIL